MNTNYFVIYNKRKCINRQAYTNFLSRFIIMEFEFMYHKFTNKNPILLIEEAKFKNKNKKGCWLIVI